VAYRCTNQIGKIHPKAMPVALTTQEQIETCMTALVEEALGWGAVIGERGPLMEAKANQTAAIAKTPRDPSLTKLKRGRSAFELRAGLPSVLGHRRF
jgi:hypothetical protein